MASSALIWELVKRNNCFLQKNLNRTVWSKEPCNLYVQALAAIELDDSRARLVRFFPFMSLAEQLLCNNV